MSKKLFALALVLSCATLYSQSLEKQYPKSITVSVTNPLKASRENVFVTIPQHQIQKVAKGFNFQSFVVMEGAKEIPSQYRKDSGIVLVLSSLAANESRALTIRFNSKGETKHNYPKRTQAELSHKTGGEWKNREYMGGAFKNVNYLRVPPEHKDHSWFIRYEGPGWESDKVGYRFYLDQRNATDVFGKTTSEMIMQQVGQDGFDSYHAMQPWGMDVMKVGKSLGIGSIGALLNNAAIRVEKTDSVTCRISDNGTEYSSITTNYYGWKIGDEFVNLQSVISIHAGTRLTHQELILNKDLDNLCTGIGKDKAATLIKDQGDEKHFGYLATYGKQSLNNDELGLVVFFNPKAFKEFTEDEFSHIVALKSAGHKLDYYFVGAWVLEQAGIKNQEQFESYLKQTAEELANPVRIQLSASKK